VVSIAGIATAMDAATTLKMNKSVKRLLLLS